jgi:hypothetical protein
MVPQRRVSSDGLAGGRSKDLPFFWLFCSSASLSLLILASAHEEEYVALVPLMPRPSFLGAAKLARSIRRRKDRSGFTSESVTRRS